MIRRGLAGSVLALLMLAGAAFFTPPAWATDGPDAAQTTLYRVFLKEGGSLLSFGEVARVDNRVVFSMPTSTSLEAPQLHLVNISAERVDWALTDEYTETVRAARYVALHGEKQYAMLSVEIGQALNDIALTTDPVKRLAIVERARRTLAEWPAFHFDYKSEEIKEMVATLDAVIAELRATAGMPPFDLAFVANTAGAPPRPALLPAPTAGEVIDSTRTAARLAESSAERVSLLSAALTGINREAEALPPSVRVGARREIRAEIASEQATDRVYQALTADLLKAASARAKAADVRGVQRVLDRIKTEDERLGGKRPDAVLALVAAVEAELNAARELRLARDRWVMRLPELRRYQSIVRGPLERLRALGAPLEDIKALAGSSPDALAGIEQVAREVLEVVSPLTPPEELRDTHAWLVSAAQLAGNAAYIRRDATLTNDIGRAWDASSAAAGALMLGARARAELATVLRSAPQPPTLPR
jgi:hypothetical protein